MAPAAIWRRFNRLQKASEGRQKRLKYGMLVVWGVSRRINRLQTGVSGVQRRLNRSGVENWCGFRRLNRLRRATRRACSRFNRIFNDPLGELFAVEPLVRGSGVRFAAVDPGLAGF